MRMEPSTVQGGIGLHPIGPKGINGEELWLHTLRKLPRPQGRHRFACTAAKRGRRRKLIQSDGLEHLGSSLTTSPDRPFPGPVGKRGPPLRILPLGGLGEIGMNCMLVGVYNRYILIDAGLMFPDFYDLGMQRILPDTSYLNQWNDKIEAVVITHGHEDHIGAIPWVLPALDPATPVYASKFVMELLKHRLEQYNLWQEERMHLMSMRMPFNLGPFQCEPFHVTHSIPDCCGLILRSDYGTIIHSGDWKIDEGPVDGRGFDISAYESVAKDGVTLLMSDSTNALTPGRSVSETEVQESLMQRVMDHSGKGRVVATMFASNLHRLTSIKKAADAADRKLCFLGMSLHTYLDAAQRSGFAPFNPKHLIPAAELEDADPNEVVVVTTGSQAEPRAALSLASRDASFSLKLNQDDLVLYSAKTIPGNEKRVMRMMNNIARKGPKIVMGRGEHLHASGHAYQDELAEVIKAVRPQHFLPIHGESVFMRKHAELAQELGVQRTRVIRDGEMLGVKHLMRRRTVSQGAMPILGEVNLVNFYNDGNKGTGTHTEMGLDDRATLAIEGVVVVAVDLHRFALLQQQGQEHLMEKSKEGAGLRARVRITTRGMWTDKGNLVKELYRRAQTAVSTLPADAALFAVERAVAQEARRACMKYNQRRPEVIVIAHEFDPRAGAAIEAHAKRAALKERKERLQQQATAQLQSEVDTQESTPREGTPEYANKRPKLRSRRKSTDDQEGHELKQPQGELKQVAINEPSSVSDISSDGNKNGNKSKRTTGSRTHSVLSKTADSSGDAFQGPIVEGDFSTKDSKEQGKSKRSPRRRSRRPISNDVDTSSDGTSSSMDIRPVPSGVMEEYRRRNPREKPGSGIADLDYG